MLGEEGVPALAFTGVAGIEPKPSRCRIAHPCLLASEVQRESNV